MVKTKTFITISNQQIYDELTAFKTQNAIDHRNIMEEIAGYKSQVFNLKLALGGIAVLSMTTLSFFVSHLLNAKG